MDHWGDRIRSPEKESGYLHGFPRGIKRSTVHGPSNGSPKKLPHKTDSFIYIPPTHVFTVRKGNLCWTEYKEEQTRRKRNWDLELCYPYEEFDISLSQGQTTTTQYGH